MTTDQADRLIEQANSQHVQHPQYAGHWDSWVVVTAKRQIKAHGQVVLEKGEAVLMDPASIHTMTEADFPRPSALGKTFATFYLARNCGGVDTSLRADYFGGAL